MFLGCFDLKLSKKNLCKGRVKSFAYKVFEKKSLERAVYLEKKRVYREEQGSALEEESENDEPVINSKRHHRQIKNLLKYNFYIPTLVRTSCQTKER